MRELAWIIAACTLFGLLPGSVLRRPIKYEDIDWSSPHAYVAIVRFFVTTALTLKVLL